MARTSEQNKQIREESKKIILSAALRQFAIRGPAATKMSDIAREAGIAQGLAYHYFASKEEIYAQLLRNAMDKMNEAINVLNGMPQSAGKKLKMAICRMVETIAQSREFCLTCALISQAISSRSAPLEVEKMLNEKRGRFYGEMAKLISAGQAEGSVLDGDPEQLTVLFWTSVNGLAIYRASDDSAKLPDPQLLMRMYFNEQ